MTTWTGYYFRINGTSDLANEDNSTLSDVDLVGPYAGDDVDGTLRANQGDTINGSEVVNIYAGQASGASIRIGGVDYSLDGFFIVGVRLANGETLVSPDFSGTQNQAIIDALNLSGGAVDSISFGTINSASGVSDPEDFNLSTARYGGPVCFASGTLIATPSGNRRVEDLSVGSIVCTLDSGPMPVRWIGRSRFRFSSGPHRHKPILIKAGSLGVGKPDRDLVVSAQHRVLLADPETCAHGRAAEVLVPAKALVGLPGIREKRGTRDVVYHALMLDSHQVLLSNNQYSESFYPGPMALRMLGEGDKADLFQRFPRLQHETYGQPARKMLGMLQARQVVRTFKTGSRSCNVRPLFNEQMRARA